MSVIEVSIRLICVEDAAPVAFLCRQLGYDLSVRQVLENITAVLSTEHNTAFVAIHENKVVGWIGVSQSVQIESAPCGEIRGLVVDDQFRKNGVGKLLVERAKLWCRENGHNKLRLRCNRKRTETHLFYQHLDFTEVKEQKVFEILL